MNALNQDELDQLMLKVLAAVIQLPWPYRLEKQFWKIEQSQIVLEAFGGNIWNSVPLPLEDIDVLIAAVNIFLHDVGEQLRTLINKPLKDHDLLVYVPGDNEVHVNRAAVRIAT